MLGHAQFCAVLFVKKCRLCFMDEKLYHSKDPDLNFDQRRVKLLSREELLIMVQVCTISSPYN